MTINRRYVVENKTLSTTKHLKNDFIPAADNSTLGMSFQMPKHHRTSQKSNHDRIHVFIVTYLSQSRPAMCLKQEGKERKTSQVNKTSCILKIPLLLGRWKRISWLCLHTISSMEQRRKLTGKSLRLQPVSWRGVWGSTWSTNWL